MDQSTETCLGCRLSCQPQAKCPTCGHQMYYDEVEEILFCREHGGCYTLTLDHPH